MKLLVLPGFSLKNKEWAQEAAEFLKNDFDVVVYEWKHWETGNDKDFSAESEAENVVNQIKKDEVYILAKSIGSLVSMILLDKIKVNKLVLCGLPFKNDAYKKLSNLKSKNVIVFQNVKDPLMPYNQVEQFIKEVNSNIKVIKKDRDDHSYPFYEDFRKFLTSGE